MKAAEVFVPNDTPTVTYVDRAEHKLQQRLKDYYELPNMIVSVSGPTKSGKTVLIKKVVPEDYLITVLGAGISTPEMLWDRVLNWMGTPDEVSNGKTVTTGGGGSTEAGGRTGIPLIAEGEAKATATFSHERANERVETRRRGGLEQVVKEIGKSEFVVFIDDFHYIKADIREEVGRQLKAAAEQGVKIFVASVPHRASDVVRSNPELRGRVAAVDMQYWTPHELEQIATKGFAALNTEIAPAHVASIAKEALGSPQLMQSICLNLCFGLSLREELKVQARTEVTPAQVVDAFSATTAFGDFSTMVAALHRGAKTRGTERKLHSFRDGSSGDVYRAILLGLQLNPADLSYHYQQVLDRVQAVCDGVAPVGSSVSSALEQMALIAEEVQPGTSPIAWQEEILDISDPYFLFYLRSSGKLHALGQN